MPALIPRNWPSVLDTTKVAITPTALLSLSFEAYCGIVRQDRYSPWCASYKYVPRVASFIEIYWYCCHSQKGYPVWVSHNWYQQRMESYHKLLVARRLCLSIAFWLLGCRQDKHCQCSRIVSEGQTNLFRILDSAIPRVINISISPGMSHKKLTKSPLRYPPYESILVKLLRLYTGLQW